MLIAVGSPLVEAALWRLVGRPRVEAGGPLGEDGSSGGDEKWMVLVVVELADGLDMQDEKRTGTNNDRDFGLSPGGHC